MACTSMWSTDSISKVSIVDSTALTNDWAGFFILMTNALYPLKIYWDNLNRLRSDSLPFENTLGTPVAQIVIENGSNQSMVVNSGYSCPYDEVLVSDTATNGFEYCMILDTIFIEHNFGSTMPEGVGMNLRINPWKGHLISNVQKLQSNKIKAFPNPAANIVFLRGSSGQTCFFYDSLGRLLLSKYMESETLDVSEFRSGLYFLKFDSLSGQALKLIIAN